MKDPEKITLRHNGKGSFEVIDTIYTKHGEFEIVIAPAVIYEDAELIKKVLGTKYNYKINN